jgi:hypothetical protein
MYLFLQKKSMIAFIKRKLKKSRAPPKKVVEYHVDVVVQRNTLLFDTLSLYREGPEVFGSLTAICLPRFDFLPLNPKSMDTLRLSGGVETFIKKAQYGYLYVAVRECKRIEDHSNYLLETMLRVYGDSEQHFIISEILVLAGCDPFAISESRRMSFISLALEMGKYQAFEGMISVPVGKGSRKNVEFINFVSAALISDIEKKTTRAVEVCLQLRAKAEAIIALSDKVNGSIDKETFLFAKYVLDVFRHENNVYGDLRPAEIIAQFPDEPSSLLLKEFCLV